MIIKICRQIDALGRLVIPSDLRKQYGLMPGDTVFFYASENGIVIQSEEVERQRNEKKSFL